MYSMPCPPDDELSGYAYEGGSSHLARFSGLCTNSTVVYACPLGYHRAGMVTVRVKSGENPIRETDTTNNTLIKYYSVYCY
jgi:hypothetical protein